MLPEERGAWIGSIDLASGRDEACYAVYNPATKEYSRITEAEFRLRRFATVFIRDPALT